MSVGKVIFSIFSSLTQMWHLSQICDPVECWNFSGAWVDFSSARGLVSLLLHRVLPRMPKAGGLRDLEVNSTSLSHNYKQIWLTWHVSFQAWKQPVSHGQDWPGIQGNLISPNAPTINQTILPYKINPSVRRDVEPTRPTGEPSRWVGWSARGGRRPAEKLSSKVCWFVNPIYMSIVLWFLSRY